jgi:hypothetical protein
MLWIPIPFASPRVRRIAAALAAIHLALASPAHVQPAPAGDAGRCTLAEIARDTLMVNGEPLYVEPEVISASPGGSLLLLGSWNYRFRWGADGSWAPVLPDSVMGAVVSTSGAASVVRAPIPSDRLQGVRAQPRPDGGWDVVFIQTGAPPSPDRRSDTAAALWHGVLRGSSWASLGRLPIPPGIVLAARRSSFIRFGDTLAWAVSRLEMGRLEGVVIYEKRGAEWTASNVGVGHAYVELMHHPERGLIAAVVQPDPARRTDGNSLLLWTRRPEWKIDRVMVEGGGERVHDPSIQTRGREAVLTWDADVRLPDGGTRGEVHAMAGSIAERDEAVIRVDSTGGEVGRSASLLWFGDGARVWMLRGHGPASPELRFVHDSGGQTVTVATLPNPFETPPHAAAVSPAEAVVSGAVRVHGQDALASLVIRLRWACDADRSALESSSGGGPG